MVVEVVVADEVVEVLVADEVVEVVAVVEVEADTVEKGQRIRAVHIAARTTIPPKTVGSGKRIRVNNSKDSHANACEMPAAIKMMSSAIIVMDPVTCAMNAN